VKLAGSKGIKGRPKQVPVLLDVMRDPFRTMVLLAVLTGLRVGEILGLRWEDVDFASSQMRVSQRCYREAVDKLSQLVTNGDELEQIAEGLPVLTQQIQ
jgi:integrase